MTAHGGSPAFPRATGFSPTQREADDGLDGVAVEGGPTGGGVFASGGRFGAEPLSSIPPSGSVPAPSYAPSVVIAPEAQIPLPVPAPSQKRATQEPTLVIRDRRKVANLRAEVQRRSSESASRRYKRTLFWGMAGLGAFLLGGGLVALLGRAGTPPNQATSASLGALPAPTPPGIMHTSVEKALASAEPRDALSVTGQPQRGSSVGDLDEPSPVVAEPEAVAVEPSPSSSTARSSEAQPSRPVPRVVSLEDLPAE